MITYAVQGNASPNPTATKLISAGEGPTLIRNNDTQFSCDISYSNMIDQATLSNAITLNAGGTIVVDGTRDVFAIGNFGAGSIQVQVVEGGISFFQRLSSLLLTDPNGSDFILLKTGSPPEIQIGTGDPAETQPTIFASVIQGAGSSRQLGTEIVANHVAGQPVGAFALIELLSGSVDHVTGPGISLAVNDGTNNNALAISGTITNSIKPIATNNQAAPTAIAQGQLYDDNAGHLSEVTPSGFSGVLGVWQVDASSNTVTQAVFTRLTKSWPIPGNDAAVATTYVLATWGTGVQGSTQETLSFRIDAFGTSGAGSGFATTFAGISTSFVWLLVAFVQVTTLGNGNGVMQLNWQVFVKPSGAATSDVLSGGSSPNTATIGATPENIFISAQWGATTGAPTITSLGSIFGRIGD